MQAALTRARWTVTSLGTGQCRPLRTHTQPATGDLKSTTAGGNPIATTEDSWGRTLTESDGEGNTAATTYDSAGRTKTVNDGKGTYTYTYDGTDAAGNTERRGLVTKLDRRSLVRA